MAAYIRRDLQGWATLVLNADQTFVNLQPEDDALLAPINSKRVGTSVKTDEKKGITVMVTAELNSGEVGVPFMVFDGNTCLCENDPGRLGGAVALVGEAGADKFHSNTLRISALPNLIER